MSYRHKIMGTTLLDSYNRRVIRTLYSNSTFKESRAARKQTYCSSGRETDCRWQWLVFTHDMCARDPKTSNLSSLGGPTLLIGVQKPWLRCNSLWVYLASYMSRVPLVRFQCLFQNNTASCSSPGRATSTSYSCSRAAAAVKLSTTAIIVI